MTQRMHTAAAATRDGRTQSRIPLVAHSTERRTAQRYAGGTGHRVSELQRMRRTTYAARTVLDFSAVPQ